MKLLLTIIVAISIILSALTPAFGFDLFSRAKTNSVNQRAYSFGDRYNYDNSGSIWNYEMGYRNHRSNRYRKYWQPRFEYEFKVEGHSDEQFQDLIDHLSEHHYQNIRPSHPNDIYHNEPFCR